MAAVPVDRPAAGPFPGHPARGTHWLIDCFGVDAALLSDVGRLEAVLCGAADDAGATRLFQHFHRFEREAGVTGVVLLAESHITIHTWPERRFAAIDLFLCGAARPGLALARIERDLAPERIVTSRNERGEAEGQAASSISGTRDVRINP